MLNIIIHSKFQNKLKNQCNHFTYLNIPSKNYHSIVESYYYIIKKIIIIVESFCYIVKECLYHYIVEKLLHARRIISSKELSLLYRRRIIT